MGEISVVRVVESVLAILIASTLMRLFDRTRRYIEEQQRPEPGGRRSIDRYWIRLAVGILNPEWIPQPRSKKAEPVRQTLTLVWDVYAWRHRLTLLLAIISVLWAIYSVLRIILMVLD